MKKNDQLIAQKLSDSYNRLNLIFYSILAPPLMAFVYLYLESKAGNIAPLLDVSPKRSIISLIFPLLTIGLIVGGFVFFKKGLKIISTGAVLTDMLNAYSKKSLLLYAMLEGGLILSVLGYYLVQTDLFLALYMIVLIFFSLYKPTLDRIANHLNIKGDKRDFLIDCRSIARGEEKEKQIKL